LVGLSDSAGSAKGVAFASYLPDLLASNPGAPLVTFYDHASGERTELSRTTYANWVAKTASYLVEECDLERGGRVQVDLPAHWLGTVFLGACWTVGISVVTKAPDAVITGPRTVNAWAGRVGSMPVVACALAPLAGRFTETLPTGVRDFGIEIWSQPDVFVPWDPPSGDDAATDDRSQAALFELAASRGLLSEGGRLASLANPVDDGLLGFAEVIAQRGSLLLVANPDRDRLTSTFDAERATVWDHPIEPG
jgi:uncharacterized protein (TIGR03089 family)